MTMSPETAANLRASAIQAGQAAAAAGAHASALAVSSAATNAAKPGSKSSELKATIGAIALTAGLATLHVLSVIPGPWMVPALALSAALAAGSYSLARGNVKAAALAAAGAAAAAAFPQQANIIRDVGTIVAAGFGPSPAPPPR
jgi:hypothetical protein